MKSRTTKGILTVLAIVFASMGVVNLTDSLPKNETKKYRKRSLDRPLYITYHHTASKGQSLKRIAQGHLHRGFPEIGYCFAIGWDGKIYQLNDVNEISWHDSGNNTNSIGIVFVGNYHEKELPDAALQSAKRLQDSLSAYLNIVGVRYHRQTSPTACPGKYAIKKLKPLLW
ncbi:peptidoglycan recognition family protein [Aquimarina hainanensis]|uniref:peptidoglycan recognition protein family protein n=1 Tax=Aquimarina hainanensis TaxID=1578017 RepID=UPI00361932D8